METFKTLSGCGGCAISRRRFVTMGGSACLGAAACVAAPGLVSHAQGRKLRLRVIYSLHEPQQARPDWPNVGFDFVPVMDRLTKGLRQACPEIEFLTSMAAGEEQAKQIVAQAEATPVDGYIVYQLNCWNRVIQTVAATGKPVLYVDFQFGGSGGFLVYNAGFLRSGASNVGFIASSRFDDMLAAVQCFKSDQRPAGTEFASAVARVRTRLTSSPGDLSCLPDPIAFLSTPECVRRLKESKILAVGDERSGPGEAVMTIPVERVAFAEVNQAWQEADKDESRAIADQWEKAARSVVGVSRATLETSAAMYLGMKAVLKKHGANAITVNCLGGFYGGHIHAYPCLGFHQLCNDGLIGACECDVESTATMVAVTALTQGRPGYISDPVIDTAKRQIIYAHCVAANRVFGPSGPANPFMIMTHSEDRQGASVRSVLPVGYLTTTLRASQGKQSLIFHQAKAVENDPDDRACRTKLGAEPVGDIEKLFREWDEWGWHRVTVYGDLKEPIFALADAIGWKIVQEA